MQLVFKCFALVFDKDQHLEIQNQWQIRVRTNRHTKLSQAYFPQFNTHRASYASFSAYYHRPLSVIHPVTHPNGFVHPHGKNAQQIPLNIPGNTCRLRPCHSSPQRRSQYLNQSLVCHLFCLCITASVPVILPGFHYISFLHPWCAVLLQLHVFISAPFQT